MKKQGFHEKSRISQNPALWPPSASEMISGGSPTLCGHHRPPGAAAIAFARACDGCGGLGEGDIWGTIRNRLGDIWGTLEAKFENPPKSTIFTQKEVFSISV